MDLISVKQGLNFIMGI